MKKAWTGILKLGFVTQPVAVYNAADSKQGKVAFNQLHAACGGRVNQQLVCKACDETKALDKDSIVKGYEYTKGQYVTLTPEELDTAKVENTKVIDLKEFVPISEINPLIIAESAFIAPVQAELADAYVLIREALAGKAGIGTLAHGNKEKLVAIVANGQGLVMHTLRHASEVRDILNVPVLAQLPTTADPKTVKLMQTLMAGLEAKTLDLEKYPNVYVENVMALVKAKIDGTAAPVAKPVAAKPVDNLAALLEASIVASKPIKKAAAKKAA